MLPPATYIVSSISALVPMAAYTAIIPLPVSHKRRYLPKSNNDKRAAMAAAKSLPCPLTTSRPSILTLLSLRRTKNTSLGTGLVLTASIAAALKSVSTSVC